MRNVWLLWVPVMSHPVSTPPSVAAPQGPADPARRAALLRELTDLYVHTPSHAPDEERRFTELALRLIEVVDAPARAVFAERLKKYGRAPQIVLRRLAELDEGPALEEAPAETLPAVSAAPAMVPEPPVEPTGETACDELAELFFSADAAERTLILTNLEFSSVAPAEPLHRVHAQQAARRLETAAFARNGYEFATILVSTLGIGHALATRIVEDQSGEPLIVAVRALDLPVDILQRVLLFLNPAIGESVRRVYDLVRLYEDLAPANARRMLSVWREASPGQAVRHQAVYYDDETRRARAEALLDSRRLRATTPASHARRRPGAA